MSVYPPPSSLLPIYNPSVYDYASESLTLSTADIYYLRKSGGIANGLITFNAGLNSPGIINVSNTTQSTNATTGALIVSGGVGIDKNVHINGTAHLNAATSLLQLTGANSSIVLSGANSIITNSNTAASTSSTTGSLRLAVGLYSGNDSLMGKVKLSAGNPLEFTQLSSPSNWYRVNAPTSVAFNVNLNFPSYASNFTDEFITGSSTQTLLNKTLTTPIISSIQPSAGQTLTLPNTSGTVALRSDFTLPILITGANLGTPSQTINQNGTAIGAPTTFSLTGKRLLISWNFSGYTGFNPKDCEMTLNIATSVSATPLTVLTGSKTIKFYINNVATHFTIPPIVYTVASGDASGTYTAYVKLTNNTDFITDSFDPYALIIQELP